MSIKLASATGPGGLSRAQIAAITAVGILGLGGSGALVYRVVSDPKTPTTAMSPDEAKLAARVEERRAKAAADARKLRQQELGQGYQFDAQGNLLGASTDSSELPQNRPLEKARGSDATSAAAAIGRGIDRGADRTSLYEDEEDYYEPKRRRGPGQGDEDAPSEPGQTPSAASASMLGYSTVAGATWASRRPEISVGGKGRDGEPKDDADRAKEDHQAKAVDRLVDTMERSTRAAAEQASAISARASGTSRPQAADPALVGPWGSRVSPGPSASGNELYAEDRPPPAQRAPLSFPAGGIGDMRIGGNIGPDQIVRQGKFLDCVLVNQIRADLVDSPVIAMVSRDYVSLDGKFVLVPAGSKLLGEAGRVQNLQQERVYIKFERVIFPDQRSAYFPERKVPALDRLGAVGTAGNVDRHLVLQFGAAVMLGMLDGLGAAVQSPSAGTNPTLRDLVMARTSGNFSSVIAGVIQKYANVVPTVTVEPGTKMKVFFAEDVRLSPYVATRDLTWVRQP